MTETFLGGVASMYLGRLKNDALRDPYSTRGYGLYLTDDQVIGVSYKKIVSKAYRPGYVSFVVFVVFLAAGLIFAWLARVPSDQPIPYAVILVPIFVGAMAFSLVNFVYLAPRTATKQIEIQEAKSLLELATQTTDIVLDRRNISQVIFKPGSINIVTKSGEWYFFGTTIFGYHGVGWGSSHWRRRLDMLRGLFRKFCSEDPPITMFVQKGKLWQTLSGQTNSPGVI